MILNSLSHKNQILSYIISLYTFVIIKTSQKYSEILCIYMRYHNIRLFYVGDKAQRLRKVRAILQKIPLPQVFLT
jgi:hypothetical protein